MMNWLQFFLWITGVYTLYYLVVILLELKGNVRLAVGKAMSNELTFNESTEPQLIEAQDDVLTVINPAAPGSGKPIKAGPKAAPEVISSGGVSLKNMFTLAREEAIIYTRPVSF
ncbi:hypothetical protein J7E50_02640 [Pedobacter sp. ISL-68]|uniref:hypothetical protein n=1 Tax=unclassified Pedobacter TaxID=2628915 RepID=UPI001BEB87CF|nr:MULTISPECIES: hypothetical protein [unclassified Pedobacter]MBT2560119.1 hypothetical protein [Pedobacter sp. ISL-64]MBT2589098.1 hypothetical protein [Pedobacter sp. ISL-68]